MTKFLSSTDLIRTLLRAVLYLVIGLALVFHTPEFRYVETTGKSFAHIAGIAVCVLAALTALTGGFVRNTSSEAKALSGPHRTDFTPLALLGRSPLDLVVFSLVIAVAINYAPEGRGQVPITMSVIGAVLGYNLWRRRSAHPVVQLVLSLGLPALLTVLALGAGHSSGELTIVATSLLASTALGESLGAISERYSGAHNPKRLRAAWQGITSLGDAHGSQRITFDIRPLFRPVSKKEAKSALKATPQYGAQPNFGALKTLFLIMFPILVVVTITAFTDEDYVTGPDAPSQISGMAAVFSLMYVGYAIIGFLGVRGWQHMTSVADHLRLSEFAEVNGFSYDPGPVLNETQTSKYSRVMWREDGWLLANALKLGEADPHSVAPVTQFSGVSEFKLPVALPHILLLRRGLRMPTFSTTTSPKREQRLQLEGDFNTYFTVFCPTGYERDALYLLTPDVMGALIDGARTFDIEIVDDRLILRTRRDLVTTDPGVWLSLARAVSALSGRSEQWARWRDDRREPLGTASPRLLTERPTGAALAGRRLRGGLGLSGILIATYIGIYLGLTGLSNLL